MPLNDQDISMIMSAIAETPQFQFLDQLMTAQNANEAEATTDELDPESEEGLEEPGLDDEPESDEGLPPEGGEGDMGPPEMGGEELPDDDLEPGDDVDTDEMTPEDEEADQHGLGSLAKLGRAGAKIGRTGIKGGRTVPRIAGPTTKGASRLPKTAKAAMAGGGAGYVAGNYDGRKSQKRKANKERKQMAQRNRQPDRNSTRQPDRYSKLLASHNSLVKDHGRLASRLDTMAREKADAERYSAIQQLAHQYPDFVEVESEAQATLYSQGASLNDQAFQQHLANVERYAQRAEAVARENRPDIPRGQAERLQPQGQADQYAAKLADETVRVYTAAINRGDTMSYEEAKEKAQEKLNK